MAIGGGAGAALLLLFLLPGEDWWHARGPMNVGHEKIACSFCHARAPGTVRQQLQANARVLLGLRQQSAPIGLLPVSNAACASCHERAEDNHPVFRFVEPRFAKARRAISPQFCTSCHLEHSGKRVTREPTFCVNCHEKLEMRSDPLDVSHAKLIAAKKWESCLGCHDFHGNHVMTLDTVVSQAFLPEQVRVYFAGGTSPYGDSLRYPATDEPIKR